MGINGIAASHDGRKKTTPTVTMIRRSSTVDAMFENYLPTESRQPSGHVCWTALFTATAGGLLVGCSAQLNSVPGIQLPRKTIAVMSCSAVSDIALNLTTSCLSSGLTPRAGADFSRVWFRDLLYGLPLPGGPRKAPRRMSSARGFFSRI